MTQEELKQTLVDKLKECDTNTLVDIIADLCLVDIGARALIDMSSANCVQQSLSNVLTDIRIQRINNYTIQKVNTNLYGKNENISSMKLKYILSESVIEWQVGTPTKSEQYLVLHLDHKGEKTINTDIWRDNGTWQSGWHDIIAWCAMSDIKI